VDQLHGDLDPWHAGELLRDRHGAALEHLRHRSRPAADRERGRHRPGVQVDMRAGARQSGQTLAMFALTLAFAFVGLIALAGDAAVVLYQYNQANSAALLGVQAGAAAVDLDLFYQGTQTLRPEKAKSDCHT